MNYLKSFSERIVSRSVTSQGIKYTVKEVPKKTYLDLVKKAQEENRQNAEKLGKALREKQQSK